MPEDGGLIGQALIGLKPVNAWVHTYTKPQTSSTRSRGLGWRIHESVEDTKLSTNKQHSLSQYSGTWVRGCASTHPGSSSLVRTAPAPPFRLPCPPPRPPSQFRTVGKKIAPNCPTDPTNFGLVFRPGSPQTLRVFGELMSNISATRGRPDMRFCVCGSPRGDLSHIASVTLGCSRSDFSGANRRVQDHTCGG